MPRGMSYNLWPNIRWGGARWSDCTGDAQTVNKDQTMLSAAWFKQDVFITVPVEIAARELLDKPQTPLKIINNFRFCFREECDQFFAIMCVHCDIFCFLQLYVSISMGLSCHNGHWRWWRLSWVHNEALYIHWSNFHVRRAPNFQEIPIMPDNTITELK